MESGPCLPHCYIQYLPYKRLAQVFVITALWDVVLRLCAEGRITVLGVHEWNWVRVLKPYFAKHTVLAAALIAGICGVSAYSVIQLRNMGRLQPIWIFTVSAAIGIVMQKSALFPILNQYYYNALPRHVTFLSDGFSGLVVYTTMLVLRAVVGALQKKR